MLSYIYLFPSLATATNLQVQQIVPFDLIRSLTSHLTHTSPSLFVDTRYQRLIPIVQMGVDWMFGCGVFSLSNPHYGGGSRAKIYFGRGARPWRESRGQGQVMR